jgi:hypothetical protein
MCKNIFERREVRLKMGKRDMCVREEGGARATVRGVRGCDHGTGKVKPRHEHSVRCGCDVRAVRSV